MKMILVSTRHALSICATIFALAGCGGLTISSSTEQLRNLALAHPLTGDGYKSLYSFKGGADGGDPVASLVDVNGALYGTTEGGGKSDDGTVFKITTSGTEHVLYSFKGGTDGAYPRAGLLAMNGTLYGTTQEGGSSSQCAPSGIGCGTVFKITTSGTEHVLYRFKGDPDGASPQAGLTVVNGTLYGTTVAGGYACGCGTVFKVSTSGNESVIYTFEGYNGQWPYAGLIAVSGTLYGTTADGGAGDYSDGTVFKITTSGMEHVLYSFGVGSGADGAAPQAGMILVKGVLYGTTEYGGDGYPCGCGTVFKITTSGVEHVIHSFGVGTSTGGELPEAGLADVNGTLYGTTYSEGSYGGGTVFKMNASGKQQVLHNFGAGTDGASPHASLIAVGGTLYGTTESGGTGCGCGTVFRLSP